MSLSRTPHLPSDDEDAEVRPRRVRPLRVLIGASLVVIGLLWSMLNAPPKTGPVASPVVHRPVETHVLRLDGLRARAQIPPGTQAAGPFDATISFHNDGLAARIVSPGDLRLQVAGLSLAPARGTARALVATLLEPGAYVSGELHFTHPLEPGATIVFTPSWDNRHALRWVLWR